MNVNTIQEFINEKWDSVVIPTLKEYIRIPNKSPAFDPEWERHGYMEKAAKLLSTWAQQQEITDLRLSIERLPGKTPLIFMEIPGESDRTLLLYGHLDKQPEMLGWDEDKHPWKPVIQEDKLFGRGSADDGYAIFAALTAIQSLQINKIPHARCVIIIEACEESGSYDLPEYVEYLKNRIGKPELVICLDSGAGNYEQLWCTTSLRGLINGKLSIEILTEGVHSGAASGVVASTFRILRQLLSRIENEKTGEIILPPLQVNIPERRIKEAEDTVEALGDEIWKPYPFVQGAKPISFNNIENILNRTWRSALCVIGIDAIPLISNAGNVLRPKTVVMLSMRIPPTCDEKKAAAALKEILEKDPPYAAKVNYTLSGVARGWNAPEITPWLEKTVQKVSQAIFNKPGLYWGEGGSIPFMAMLSQQFPQAQFIITGVLGPHSNAHGPNEFLHIPYVKKVTACIAGIIAEHFRYISNGSIGPSC